MLQECLMSNYQTKFSMENFRKESTLKMAKRNATLKASRKDFNISTEPGNRLHRNEQSGVVAPHYEAKRICEAERKCYKSLLLKGMFARVYHISIYTF